MPNDELINPGNYISPGYAVSSELQSILARKKLEQRQAMLDALETQKVNASISESGIRAGADKQRADADMLRAQGEEKWRNSQAQGEYLKRFHMGQNVNDGALNEMKGLGMDPDTYFPSTPTDPYSPGANYSYQEGTGGQDDSGATLPERVAPATRKFVGSPAEQKESDIEKSLRSAIEDNTFSPDTRQGLRDTLMLKSMGVPVSISSESLMKQPPQTKHHLYTINDSNPGVKNDLGEIDSTSDEIRMIPHPPREPQQQLTTKQLVNVDDPDNPGHQKTMVYDPKNDTWSESPFNKPKTGGSGVAPKFALNAGDIHAVNTAATDFNNNNGFLSGWTGGRDRTKAALDRTFSEVINKAPSERVKSWIFKQILPNRDFLMNSTKLDSKDPKHRSIDQIKMSISNFVPDLTEDEANQVNALIPIILSVN